MYCIEWIGKHMFEIATRCLAGSCRGFPIPWLLLAFLVWYLVNMYFFPPKPKDQPAAATTQE
jgi:hypothetical protein